MELITMPPPPPPINIQLTSREANILLAMMQNPVVGDSIEIIDFRENLFTLLSRALREGS